MRQPGPRPATATEAQHSTRGDIWIPPKQAAQIAKRSDFKAALAGAMSAADFGGIAAVPETGKLPADKLPEEALTTALLGAPGGVAELDEGSRLPANRLPNEISAIVLHRSEESATLDEIVLLNNELAIELKDGFPIGLRKGDGATPGGLRIPIPKVIQGSVATGYASTDFITIASFTVPAGHVGLFSFCLDSYMPEAGGLKVRLVNSVGAEALFAATAYADGITSSLFTPVATGPEASEVLMASAPMLVAAGLSDIIYDVQLALVSAAEGRTIAAASLTGLVTFGQ